MTPTHRFFKTSRLSACIALAFPLWSGAAFAQSTFASSGSYSVGADRNSFTGIPGQPQSGSFTRPATSGSVWDSISATPPERFEPYAAVGASARGDGHFGGYTRTSEGYGTQAPMTTRLQMVYSDQLTNNSATGQAASFALDISNLLFAYDYGAHGYGINRVSFAASVYVDGRASPLWTSTFTYEDGSRSSAVSGADIGLGSALSTAIADDCKDPYGYGYGCTFRSGTFGISGYATSVALGTVGAGETVGIRYVVDLGTETDLYGGAASITFNDPSQFSTSGPAAGHLAFDGAGATVAAVPEPESYAMMAAGLAVVGAARRRRRR